jgi:FkbM family methyltransferase
LDKIVKYILSGYAASEYKDSMEEKEMILSKIVKWPFRMVKENFLKNIYERFEDQITSQKLINKLMAEHLAGVQFYGQELQDMYAYLYFKGKKDGFFIDIGAYDGFTISNTYSLEKIGWEGICIEPVPNIFERLIKNRKCECINAALSDNDIVDSKFIQTKGGRSGFTRNMSNEMQTAAEKEGIIAEINVKSVTFDTIMDNHHIKYIDFMSVDVEGSEIEILKTINFDKYKFGLITIENNYGKDQLKSFMRLRGYKILLNVGVDILFIPIETDVGMYWWKEPQ